MENRRKNLSSQLAHFEETTKNFLCSTATSRKKKNNNKKQTNKQKNIRLRRRGLFCIHPLTWSLESSRLKNAARIHTHPRRTIDDQSGGEQRRRQFSRTIERAYSSVLENFAAVFPDPADLGPKDTKRDPLLSWYNFTLAIFAAYNHRH